MSSLQNPAGQWLVAVDGGGSKIAVAAIPLANESGKRRDWNFKGTGSAHPSTWNQAADNLCHTLHEVASVLNQDGQAIVAVRLALAGAGRAEDQARVIELIRSRCAWLASVDVTCTGDIEPLVDHATGNIRAIAVILGTGSVVASRNKAGEIVRAGGWGPLLGDACSGGAIGLSALRYVCQLIDEGQNWELMTKLAQVVAAELDMLVPNNDVSLHSKLIQTASDRTRAAALAGVVLEYAWQTKDRDAVELLDPHVADIVWQIRQVARRCGVHEQPLQINFAGGISRHHPPLRETILVACGSAGLNVIAEELVDPVDCILEIMTKKLYARSTGPAPNGAD